MAAMTVAWSVDYVCFCIIAMNSLRDGSARVEIFKVGRMQSISAIMVIASFAIIQ